MSTHMIPTIGAESVVTRAEGEYPTYTLTMGEPVGAMTPITVTPDLTPLQAERLQDWSLEARTGYRGLSSTDVANLRTYEELPTPTQAQTIAATKAIIRTLRSVIVDT